MLSSLIIYGLINTSQKSISPERLIAKSCVTPQKFYKTQVKGPEATCVEIATEMKKCFRLKDMLNFNIAWNF